MVKLLHAAPILVYAPMMGYALLAIVAGICAARRRSLPSWFWSLTLLLLALVLINVAAGALVYLSGAQPRRAIHLLYGLLVLGTGLLQYWLRPGGFLRRPPGGALTRDQVLTIALIALTQAALIMRAWMTGAGVGVR
jgi:hypothetical protein